MLLTIIAKNREPYLRTFPMVLPPLEDILIFVECQMKYGKLLYKIF